LFKTSAVFTAFHEMAALLSALMMQATSVPTHITEHRNSECYMAAHLSCYGTSGRCVSYCNVRVLAVACVIQSRSVCRTATLNVVGLEDSH
jgi:hypothetical protein